MRLSNKISIALAGLVVLMAGVFFGISQGYTVRLFNRYAITAEQSSAEQWAQYLAGYYTANGDSWSNAQLFIAGILESQPGRALRDETLTLVNPTTNKVIFKVSGSNSPDNNSNAQGYQLQVSIPVAGKTVGVLYLSDRGTQGLFQLQRTIRHSMSAAIVYGTLATAVVALALGLLFARRLTQPLQSMTTAMKKIEDGDLDTRLSISGKDEFAQVASAFNAMIDRLHETEHSRRHLVADVAHELRTPLTIMQGKLELIQQGVEPASPENLLPIQDEIVRLTMLVQDLHQLSLAEVGQLPLHKEPTEMNELLERLVDNFSFEADDAGIHLAFRPLSESPVLANVDSNRITQVFVNLVGNALRYTPPGGSIIVTQQRVGSHVQITVQDTGQGIAAEHLGHIFDRFYRVQEDRSRASGGTGLGLAIAKEFVEAQGGSITVTSEIGAGTTFAVTLPVADTGESPA